MKILVSLRRNSFFLSLLFLVLFFCSKSVVFASDVTVTANVPDTEAPSVPILIEPSDGALISDNTPSFKWYESTDNISMNYYVFYLNGSVLYNNVPLTSADNNLYTLEYDALNGIYTLTPKNAFGDGSKTWKVVAVDYAYNRSSSDTWDFTIDTQAPSFVLKKIGDTSVSISAADESTVPDNPIVIFSNDATANEPLLVAIGEANSTVQLTVTIPNDPTQSFTKTIDGSGNYELQLGILPRDTDIRLDFIIIDLVGHVSVLDGVYFRIALQYWPTASPTPTITTTITPIPSTTITGTPSVTVTPVPSTTTWPTPTLSPTEIPKPSISIFPTGIVPIIPPKEIIHEASDELIEMLPDTTETSVRAFLQSKTWLNISRYIPFLFLLIFYFVSLSLILSKFIQQASFKLLKNIFALLFPYFYSDKKNLIFEYGETLVAPLIMIELLDEKQHVLDFKITDSKGNFSDFSAPHDKAWYLSVMDSNFYFPIGDQRPEQLDFLKFYQGQELNSENYRNEPILIPTLRATGQDKLPFIERVRLFFLYLLNYPIWFLVVCVIFSLLFTLRYQSMFNSFVSLFYLAIILIKSYQFYRKQKLLSFAVSTQNADNFSDNLIVSIFEKSTLKAISSVVPFEFSKSAKIRHDLREAEIIAFARNIDLENVGSITENKDIILDKKDQEVVIQIRKN